MREHDEDEQEKKDKIITVVLIGVTLFSLVLAAILNRQICVKTIRETVPQVSAPIMSEDVVFEAVDGTQLGKFTDKELKNFEGDAVSCLRVLTKQVLGYINETHETTKNS